ncbi:MULTISPECIES: hypothetical protein [Lactobacillus]|uniref:hypothetical protein n=1 Tax=Lactobacillus TaxID=1578 RepID=UPI000CD9DD75|nr:MULTISPECIES: hypothetical protein [Lactobacillus]RVU73116.1 hypothetical protein EJK20_09505 [Lactobacillus xujianguonis]
MLEDSLVDQNKDMAFLKLIISLDALLERKNDVRDVRTQLSENIMFILKLDILSKKGKDILQILFLKPTIKDRY